MPVLANQSILTADYRKHTFPRRPIQPFPAYLNVSSAKNNGKKWDGTLFVWEECKVQYAVFLLYFLMSGFYTFVPTCLGFFF